MSVDTDILITLGVMVLCLLAEAFFSGSEIGIVSADRIKLRHEAAKGSRGARLILKMLEKPEWLLSTTLTGTNIAVVANTTVVTALAIQLLGEKYSWVAVAVVAPLIWIFGEIVPKAIFQQRADDLAPRAVFLLRLFSWLFSPVLIILTSITWVLGRIFGGNGPTSPFTLREEIVSMMEMALPGGDIKPSEQSMIRRVFDFSETTVGDIMVPLIKVAGVERNARCGEVMSVSVKSAHKRLPVHDRRVDRVIGIVNALDLLGEAPDLPITPYVRPVRYVPAAKNIEELLLEFRRDGMSLAVVVDEFGGAEGIVTVEDILEEVVGDLEDEHDSGRGASSILRRIDDRTCVVNAHVELGTLKERLGIDLPVDDDYETLAGFLINLARDIPKIGTTIRHQTVVFTVEKGTEQTLQEVRIHW